jgi:uncharacterized Zn finger protein
MTRRGSPSAGARDARRTWPIDRRTLRRMAGECSFKRGEDYLESGRVDSLVEHDGTIAATVQPEFETRRHAKRRNSPVVAMG